jgi:predicted solute-binding protein
MSTQLHIEQMTVAEKLRIMDELWKDWRSRADGLPMPQWHKDLLNERERLIESGEAQFDDWDAAKERLREQTSISPTLQEYPRFRNRLPDARHMIDK